MPEIMTAATMIASHADLTAKAEALISMDEAGLTATQVQEREEEGGAIYARVGHLDDELVITLGTRVDGLGKVGIALAMAAADPDDDGFMPLMMSGMADLLRSVAATT